MTGGCAPRWRDDRGAATVVAAAAAGVLVLLLGLGVALGTAVLARHRAEHAADLAALTAASEAVRGRDVACARAAMTAERNGGRLASCTWAGWSAEVQVVATCRCVPTVSGTVSAGARAGPVVTFDTTNGGLGDHAERPRTGGVETNGARPQVSGVPIGR